MFDIIIFKNNKKKKKLKSFVREKLALDYFNSLLDKSNKIEFKKKYESGYECKFNIAIVSDRFVDKSIYYLDEFGRNKVIDSKIDDANYIQKISPYFYEENIFDVKNNTKISFDIFKKKYFKKDKIHMVSKLKNKGFTLIPTLLYINEKGFAKLQIHLAKGKKLYDKRESLKTKDATREMARKIK